jgi:hypothetical protein
MLDKKFDVARIMLTGVDGNWKEELKAIDALIDSDPDAVKICQRFYKDFKESPRQLAMGFIQFGWSLRKALGDSLLKKGD